MKTQVGVPTFLENGIPHRRPSYPTIEVNTTATFLLGSSCRALSEIIGYLHNTVGLCSGYWALSKLQRGLRCYRALSCCAQTSRTSWRWATGRSEVPDSLSSTSKDGLLHTATVPLACANACPRCARGWLNGSRKGKVITAT